MTMYETALAASKRLKFEFPYDVKEWVDKGMLIENQHKHTCWSNLVQMDSATTIDEFIVRSQEYGCQCYFSGEHGYPGEWLYVYNVCKDKGIKFRYSVEAYWIKDINSDEKDRTNCHIVLIARNYAGIRKLNYLITRAHSDGFYYKPRIDLNMLFELDPSDVYVCSACIAGWAYPDATEIWYRIWKHFGDSFFFEYQYHDIPRQKEINSIIHTLSKQYGIQTIVGLDTHYLDDVDRVKRNTVLARKKIKYDDENEMRLDFPNGEEVFNRFKKQGILSDEDILYSMMNTHVFLSGCEELVYNTDFKIPVLPEYANLSYEQRSDALHNLLHDKYIKAPIHSPEREAAIEYEYGEISGSGTVDYFLSNQKLIDLAVNKYGGTLTTTSRGSASSYYTSNLCGFTTVDRFESEVPIYPERFITKDRILSSHQMPD